MYVTKEYFILLYLETNFEDIDIFQLKFSFRGIIFIIIILNNN